MKVQDVGLYQLSCEITDRMLFMIVVLSFSFFLLSLSSTVYQWLSKLVMLFSSVASTSRRKRYCVDNL